MSGLAAITTAPRTRFPPLASVHYLPAFPALSAKQGPSRLPNLVLPVD